LKKINDLVSEYLQEIKGFDTRVIIRSRAVAKRMESKTPEHARHAWHGKRVGAVAARVAGCLQEDVCTAFLAGLNHDAGKLFVPAYLLRDDTDFDDKKYQLIQLHAVAGFHLFKDICLDLALIIGRVHNTDDNGYGVSLSDYLSDASQSQINAINFNSRLVSICDYIDSNRTRPPRLGKDVFSDGSYVSLEKQLFKKYPQNQRIVVAALSVYSELF